MVAHDYISALYRAMDRALETGHPADWDAVKNLFAQRPATLKGVKLVGLKQVALIYTLVTQGRLPRSYALSFAGINLQALVMTSSYLEVNASVTF